MELKITAEEEFGLGKFFQGEHQEMSNICIIAPKIQLFKMMHKCYLKL